MASATSSRQPPAFGPSQPLVEWWAQQWVQGITPMTRIQLAWMECLTDMMQQEARFLAALSTAGEQLGKCYETHGSNPQKMQECYEEIAREVADQHMQRLKQVSNLPHEFRRCIWEEL